MEKVAIKNQETFAGSVEWLKSQLQNMKFKFSHRDGVPSISYGKLEKEESGTDKVKTWCTLAIIAESEEVRHKFYEVCDEYNNMYITFPCANGIAEHQWSMFTYLTPNAKVYCSRLIRKLADELSKKASDDKGALVIKVVVE